MEQLFVGMLTREHHLDLLAEAARERLAGCVAGHPWRARLGSALVRLGQFVNPAPDSEASRALAQRPCTAC